MCLTKFIKNTEILHLDGDLLMNYWICSKGFKFLFSNLYDLPDDATTQPLVYLAQISGLSLSNANIFSITTIIINS